MKRFLSLAIAVLMVISLLPANVLATDTATTSEESTAKVLYFNPGSDWLDANARFAAYFFEDGNYQWVDAVKLDNTYYSVQVPTDHDYPNVIFCRMNPETTENNWSNKWNQTVDLVTADGNCFTITNSWGDWENENKATGEWSNVSTGTRTLYVKNTADWEQVYAFYWRDKSRLDWPGVEMTKVEGEDNIWFIEVLSAYDNIVFNNNNGAQTNDLIIDANNDLFTVGEQVDGKYNGTWSVFEPTVAINSTTEEHYSSLTAAVAAANDGDEITVVADLSDETVTVDKSVTITGQATLNNVKLTISGTTVGLTVSNLTFTGNSYINAGDGAALTVTNVTADVDPAEVNDNSRAAFIVLGTNEPTHGLKLTVTDNTILSAQSSDDSFSAAIFGWRYLDNGSVISGNTFGSAEERYTFIAVKTMNAMDGATITIANNTVYGTAENWKFKAFDLYQNCSRDNTYTVLSINNDIRVNPGPYTYVAFYLEGSEKIVEGPNSNVILLDKGTTFNGATLTMEYVDASGLNESYDKFYGINVERDDSGIISGTFGGNMDTLNEYVAEGYKAAADADAEGNFNIVPKVYVAELNGKQYDSVDEALAAAKADDTVKLIADCVSEADTTINADSVLDLNGYQLTVNSITAFGDIIDGENGGNGGLIVSDVDANVMLQKDNEFLPMYDTDNSCYRFFRYELVTKGSKAVDGNTKAAKFGFAITFANQDGYELLAQAATNGVKLTLNVDWTDKPADQVVLFTFSDTTVTDYAQTVLGGKTNVAMTVTVFNLDVLEAGNYIKVTPSLNVENTGVAVSGDAISYTVSAE